MDERDLRALITLQAVARTGGFAAAAREQGTTRAAVSRLVGEAEGRCGVRLCHRTTRHVTLTEAAIELLREADEPLARLRSAWSALPESAGAYRGTLRAACSHGLGRRVVLPVVRRWRQDHPQVRVHVRLGDTREDLVTRALDVALRIGPLPDSSLVARTLGRVRVHVVATPSLAGRRRPRTLEELGALPRVGYEPDEGGPRPWHVSGDDPRSPRTLRALVAPGRADVTVNSIDAVADLVRDGAGFALLPGYLVEDDLRKRRLVTLLPDLPLVGPELHLCHAHRTLVPSRVRAFMAALTEAAKPVLRRERFRSLPHRRPRRPECPSHRRAPP